MGLVRRLFRSVAARVAVVAAAVLVPLSFVLAGTAGAVTTCTTTPHAFACGTATVVKAATTVQTAAKTGLSHGIAVGVIVFGILFAFTVILLLVRKARRA